MRLEIVTLFVVIFSLSMGFISCSNSQRSKEMTDAEEFMESKPDSALKLLESLSYSDFRNEEEQALYALLYTQALDKNYLSPTNDSLISIAVDYYKSTKEPLKQVLSNYYQGRVRYNADNAQSAIVSFFKAKEIAEANGYDFWAGMACRGISDIYNGTYNAAEELFFAKEEYDKIRKSKRQPYLNYAMHDLGRALRNNSKNKESIDLASQLQDSAIKYNDPFLYNSALQLKAYNLIDLGNFKDAQILLSNICSGEFAEPIDTLYLCHSLFETGNREEAEALLQVASDANLPLKSQLRYKAAKMSHNYSTALSEAEYIDSLANADFRLAMSHNLTSSITDYYDLNKKLDEAEIKASRIMIWAITLISISIIFLLVWVGLYIYKLQKVKISEKVLLANQLQDDLDKSRRDNSNSTLIIKSLMSSKYELLEELSSIVLTNNDTKVARKKIADAVTRIIDDLSIRSDKIVLLENKVDSLHNNLITDFKNDLPNLKEVDYRLFLFSVLGLSCATISLFLKEDKIDAVYNRKRRLKNKIKQLNPEKTSRYLEYFS